MFRIVIFLGVTLLSGCSKSDSIEDRLVGEYVYERETFNGGTFEDQDVKGLMTFNSDETGLWNPADGVFTGAAPEFEWDLQGDDTRIAITRSSSFLDDNIYSTLVYDLSENDGVFSFRYFFEFENFQDTTSSIVRFENIILTPVR